MVVVDRSQGLLFHDLSVVRECTFDIHFKGADNGLNYGEEPAYIGENN